MKNAQSKGQKPKARPKPNKIEKPLLTTGEAAELLNVSPRTLENWRRQGIGPAFIKMGSGGQRASARYSHADLIEYVEASMILVKS